MTSPMHITPDNPSGGIIRPAKDALLQSITKLGINCPAAFMSIECRWWEEDELPRCYRYHLYDLAIFSSRFPTLLKSPQLYNSVDLFLLHRAKCGLELHIPKFLASLCLPSTSEHSPHPALVDAMCLAACAFSRKAGLRRHEPYLLSQTRKHLAESLAQADRLFDFIRASAILARYLTFRGRLAEGFNTISTCAHFTIACRLHKITSRVWSESSPWSLSSGSLLAPPAKSVELGERIDGFWQVFVIERAFTSSSGLTSAFVDDVGTILSRNAIVVVSNSARPFTGYRDGVSTAHVPLRNGINLKYLTALPKN